MKALIIRIIRCVIYMAQETKEDRMKLALEHGLTLRCGDRAGRLPAQDNLRNL